MKENLILNVFIAKQYHFHEKIILIMCNILERPHRTFWERFDGNVSSGGSSIYEFQHYLWGIYTHCILHTIHTTLHTRTMQILFVYKKCHTNYWTDN